MYPYYLIDAGFLTVNLYGVLMAVGIILCLIVFLIYAKKGGMNEYVKYDALMMIMISIAFGILFAFIFQTFYRAIETGVWEWGGMTFLGGLIGGTGAFFAQFALVLRFAKWKHYSKKEFQDGVKLLLQITPCSVAVAHLFGRLGCFCSGCCYGIETDSALGVHFVVFWGRNGLVGVHDSHLRLPTQLFEVFTEMIMFAVCSVLYFKQRKFTFPTYLFGYGVARFVIEFYRDDSRGGVAGSLLSPSQIISLLMVIGALAWTVWIFVRNRKKTTNDKPINN